VPPKSPGDIRNLLLVGFFDWAAVITMAKRCRDFGIALHLVAVVHQRGGFRRELLPPSIGDYFEMQWDEISSPEGPLAVARFAEQVQADAVFSADEGLLLWLAQHRSVFEPGRRVMAGPAESYAALLSKRAQEGIAREAGFDVLPSWYLQRPEDADSALSDAEYPLCLRPTATNSVEPDFKAVILHSRAEVKSFLAARTRITSPILAQTFHYGPNYVVHAARSCTGEILAVEAYRGYHKFRGFSVSIEPAKISPEVREACVRFAALAGLVGVFHFDLLYSVGTERMLFLEVNPRMGGTTSKVVQLGYDEPLQAFRAFGLPVRSAPMPPPTVRATGKRAVLREVSALLRNEDRHFSYPRRNRWLSLTRSFLDLSFGDDHVLRGLGLRQRIWYLTHSFGG
jgi:hypothetical protein